MERIFLIGFPKVGTTSLHYAFKSVGYNSIHWAPDWYWDPYYDIHGNKLKEPNSIRSGSDTLTLLNGYRIKKAKEEKKNLLHYLSEFNAFTQMDATMPPLFSYWPQLEDVPTLREQYPDGKFIFNDRILDKWVVSVTNWRPNGWKNTLRERIVESDLPGLPLGVGEKDEDIKKWYLWHKNNMIDYFKNKNNFIVFNIEQDSHKKLEEFLGVKNLVINHINKS